jgi:hypothetical protein
MGLCNSDDQTRKEPVMTRKLILILTFCSLAAGVRPLRAQTTGQEPDVFGKIEAHRNGEAEARADIRNVLERPELRDPARALGVDLETAQSRVDLLDGEALELAHKRATTLDAMLDRRATISINSTTLIILLLLLIILILAV